jgi:hypothetical protein
MDPRIAWKGDATRRRAVRSAKRSMAAAARRFSAQVVAAARAASRAACAALMAARASKWARRSGVGRGMTAEV